MSFDSQNVWIAYNHFYQDPADSTYLLQIEPVTVPEPATTHLLALAGGLLCLLLRRRVSRRSRTAQADAP